MLIAAIVVLVASIVLPIAINIFTGNTPPSYLKPYAKLSLPAIAFSAILLMAMAARARYRATSSRSNPAQRLSPKNRINLIEQVQHRINERADKSLNQIARITLNLQEASHLIVRPEHLMVQPLTGNVINTVPSLNILEKFKHADESLLVLGAPGSGKSTLLSELAQELLNKSRNNDELGIPVVVDLASWALDITLEHPPTPTAVKMQASVKRRRHVSVQRELARFGPVPGQQANFHRWLLSELNRIYKIPRHISEIWLRERKLIILLDGLDEMPPSVRPQCVSAINRFLEQFSLPPLAVCCRLADYQRLKNRLTMQGAVKIQPLSRSQIDSYLEAAGHRVSGVRNALSRDPTLWELLDSPLMLNVMVLAYHDRSSNEISILGTSIAESRRRLIDAYVTEVLRRRAVPVARYRYSQTIRWLAQIAYCSSLPGNALPMRRSWRGWRMRWTNTAPESQLRVLLSAFFPWVVGLPIVFGISLPLAERLGVVPMYMSLIPIVIIQCSYVLFTRPIRRKRMGYSSYRRLRIRGIAIGLVLAGLYYALLTRTSVIQIIPYVAVHLMVATSALFLFVSIVAVAEQRIRPAFIESAYWAAIVGGLACLFLVYRWHPRIVELVAAFSVGFFATIIFASLLTVTLLFIDYGDEARVFPRQPDWRALVVPIGLTFITSASLLASSIRVGHARPSFIVGAAAGAIWAMPIGAIIAGIFGFGLLPFKLLYAWLGLLPLRLCRFCEYLVDRNLMFRERGGYVFIHTIFREYFEGVFRAWMKSWDSTIYENESEPASDIGR